MSAIVPDTPSQGRALELPSLLLLLSLLCLVSFAFLAPLLSFTLFGSDSGEYYRLTQLLLANGHLPVGASYSGGYTGWGYGYPDFPGMMVLAGAFAGASGQAVFPVLTVFLPAVSAMSVLPLFLLFRRLYPQDAIAILGAGFASVAMPRLFSIAHPAPLALGDLLVVAGLWMFVEGRVDRRWYPPLALVGGALIVTHHLSSYFFLVAALGGLLFLELWRPRSWSVRFPLRELAFLGAFSAGMLAFWFDYATDFHGVLEMGGIPGTLTSTPLPFIAAALVGIAGAGALLRLRRQHAPAPRYRVRFPDGHVLLRDGAVIAGGVAIGLAALLVVPLPATHQFIAPSTLLWFSPFVLYAGFAAGARRTLSLSRIAPFALTVTAALGLSALFALATNNPVLLPSRHAEYLVLPLGLIVAPTIGFLALEAEGAWGRRGLLAIGVAAVALLGANAAIAYPPPADFGGFQEGLTPGDAALWMWAGTTMPPGTVVATDHRLSSMMFGFDGFYATWQDTPYLFNGSSWPAAAAELRDIPAPHCPYRFPVQLVAVDGVMYQGVALDPSQPAQALGAGAQVWFAGAPFLPLYENGQDAVYWVDGPVGSPLASPSCTGT